MQLNVLTQHFIQDWIFRQSALQGDGLCYTETGLLAQSDSEERVNATGSDLNAKDLFIEAVMRCWWVDRQTAGRTSSTRKAEQICCKMYPGKHQNT